MRVGERPSFDEVHDRSPLEHKSRYQLRRLATDTDFFFSMHCRDRIQMCRLTSTNRVAMWTRRRPLNTGDI